MRRRPPPSPLPQRDGLDPVHVCLPAGGSWATVGEALAERLPGAPDGAVAALFAEGRVTAADGSSVPADHPCPGRPLHLWFHRDPAPEEPVPFAVDVLHRDARVVVADKPHFLATTPNGRHVTETALVRLRRELGLTALAPAHRLDRLTAGVVLFTADPEVRGAYQVLFQSRSVAKSYRAVARLDDPSGWVRRGPRTVRSRLVKERGELATRTVAGEPNSESRVRLLDHRDGLGLFELVPLTGRTHQLRAHMAALGVPILGDPLYPEIRDPDPGGNEDFREPLQLLARTLEFTDPFTGHPRRFVSRRGLAAWDEAAGAAGATGAAGADADMPEAGRP